MKLQQQISFPREMVCAEGDIGKYMFFVEAGRIDIKSGDFQVTYATLGPGAFVGEIAILTGLRRTASIVTKTMCKFMLLYKRDFEDVLIDFPDYKVRTNRTTVTSATAALSMTHSLHRCAGEVS